jgi:hypothetical protein
LGAQPLRRQVQPAIGDSRLYAVGAQIGGQVFRKFRRRQGLAGLGQQTETAGGNLGRGGARGQALQHGAERRAGRQGQARIAEDLDQVQLAPTADKCGRSGTGEYLAGTRADYAGGCCRQTRKAEAVTGWPPCGRQYDSRESKRCAVGVGQPYDERTDPSALDKLLQCLVDFLMVDKGHHVANIAVAERIGHPAEMRAECACGEVHYAGDFGFDQHFGSGKCERDKTFVVVLAPKIYLVSRR